MELSDKIRIIRKARGFSQEKLGGTLAGENDSGISRQSISDWESGKSEPKLDNIRDLARVLNVSFDALLDDGIDLNDQAVLNAILKNSEPKVKDRVKSEFRYRLYQYNVTKLDYLKVYISFGIIGSLLIAFIILLILSLNEIVSGWLAFSFGAAFAVSLGILPLPISGIKEIKNGGLSLSFGELNNTHLIVNTTKTTSNTIYVPVEKIERIELAKDAKKTHGSVMIYVSGRIRPITLIDIKNPGKLIEVFNNLHSYIEDTNEIKLFDLSKEKEGGMMNE